MKKDPKQQIWLNSKLDLGLVQQEKKYGWNKKKLKMKINDNCIYKFK